jgi:hypothetical protein
MDEKVREVMCCILCYNSLLDVSSLITTQARKWIISYYKINVIMTLKKHMNADHVVIKKKLKKKFIVLWGGYWRDN